MIINVDKTENGYRLRTGKENILQEKEITENGEILPDEEYVGFSKVDVNIQPVLQEKLFEENMNLMKTMKDFQK